MKKILFLIMLLFLTVSLSALDINLFYTIVNDYRENKGLEKLEVDNGLELYAKEYIKGCMEKGHMIHNLWPLDKVKRILYDKSELNYKYIDEIIQEGTQEYISSELDVFMNFLSSPPHKASMEREDFETIGAAWQTDDNGIIYFAAYIGDLNE